MRKTVKDILELSLETFGFRVRKEKDVVCYEITDGERTIGLFLYERRAARMSWGENASYGKLFSELTSADLEKLKKIGELGVVFDQKDIPVGITFRLLKSKLFKKEEKKEKTETSPPLF